MINDVLTTSLESGCVEHIARTTTATPSPHLASGLCRALSQRKAQPRQQAQWLTLTPLQGITKATFVQSSVCFGARQLSYKRPRATLCEPAQVVPARTSNNPFEHKALAQQSNGKQLHEGSNCFWPLACFTSSRATWHSPIRKLREGSSTATVQCCWSTRVITAEQL